MSADNTGWKSLHTRKEPAMSDPISPSFEPQSVTGSGVPSGITAPDVASIFAPVAAQPSIAAQTAPNSPLAGSPPMNQNDELDALSKKPSSNPAPDASAWKRRFTSAGLFLCGLTCGIIGMKMFGPRAASPASASASVAPQQSPIPDSARAKPAPRKTNSASSPKGSAADAVHDEESAKKNNLLTLLQSLRSQLELYKIQHNDKLPEMSRYPAWAQLTKKTRPDGTPSAEGSFGPYLQSPPVNPLNGFAGIGLMKKAPTPGHVTRAEKLGFIFVTTTGEIVAMDKDGKTVFDEAAARSESQSTERKPARPPTPTASAPAATQSPTASPRGETPESRLRSAMSTLLTLKAQIEQYRKEHERNPDFAKNPMWEQLLRKTARDGTVLTTTAKESFGPYLAQIPTNPLNGHAAVEPVAKLTAYRPANKSKTGYVFETTTGKLFLTDTMGVPIRD
jgi:hypothetical protein